MEYFLSFDDTALEMRGKNTIRIFFSARIIFELAFEVAVTSLRQQACQNELTLTEW